MKTQRALLTALLLLASVIITACFSKKPLPAAPGMSIQIKPASAALPDHYPSTNETLQVYWFGSGCHVLKLGNQVLLTDPFFANWVPSRQLGPRRDYVENILQSIPRPQAILVNHSHFDHFLDAKAALDTPGWKDVNLYGGLTCKHIMAGWQKPVTERVIALPENGGPQHLRTGLSFHSYRSSHSPHLSCGFTFLNHNLTQERSSPPRFITDYPAGETYNFLIRMCSTRGATPRPKFSIFYLAAPADLDKWPNSLPLNITPVDLVIVPAPGQDNVSEFPQEHLARLQPRHVIINHFNHLVGQDFDNPDRPGRGLDRRLQILGKDLARPEELARKIQDTVNKDSAWKKRFEAIHIPSLTSIQSTEQAQNVILLKK